jgi:class 3 adenylate cyclase
VGDAAAFRLVDDHFDLLRDAIEGNGGVVVKTMGDAVMAAFTDPNDCVHAALEALERFEEFRTSSEHRALTGLKLGMHTGACYVVTANGALDYFGQTVNIASRVQHLAGSGELVLGKEHFAALRTSERGYLELVQEFSQAVKGVDTPLQLVRARLAPGRSVMKETKAQAMSSSRREAGAKRTSA